ncbi:alginate lyase family protein [Hymenobacter koreensis]|uniref:Alginate lyase family protein n=1 Tax=Hymenobacter koreensis TaxID=1084523 RepID=A0ABP8IY57_9BACT
MQYAGKWWGLIWGLLLGGAAQAAAPNTLRLLDSAAMTAYRAAYRRGSLAETQAVQAVLRQADQALKRGPYTVTDKKQLPPSGDRHDFVSQAPYFWPDPRKPGGRPYIQKDGLVNPESQQLKDAEHLSKLCEDVKALALAYYFTTRQPYAAHAARLLRVFFLDPATRMNPNLNFGQGIPGTAPGRSYGIIRTRHLVDVPEALGLLRGSPSADAALETGLKTWFRLYTRWLTSSELGREEGRSSNNHGTFYDVQLVSFALFTGDSALARRTIHTQTLPRLAVQLALDGAQPLELARTRPWNYTTMNLQGWVQLAVLARHVGVDLWHYSTPDGRGLRPAVAWFKPYLLSEKQLDRPDAAPANHTTILALYHHAAPHYPELEAALVLARYPDFIPTPWTL